MLKKIFYLLLLSFSFNSSFSQILYSERFNALTLTTGTNSASQNYLYSNIPSGMDTINNGHLIAETLTGNYPFGANGQKHKAWLAYKPTNVNDTFAVSTSWLNPTGTASAYLITPLIKNITNNTVLTWEALAPDINNADGYEVYISTATTTPVTNDFTNLVFSSAAEKNTWQKHGISLAQFAGDSIRIAFKNNSSDKYQLWIDDIIVENISIKYDVSAVSQEVYKYSVVNTNNAIAATFKNNGYEPISNLTIKYKMDNGIEVQEIKILSPALNYLESQQLTFSVPYFSNTPIYNNFKIWATSINGQTDQLHNNDTIKGAITISASVPAKKVLVEQFTSAADAASPNGQVVMQSIVSTNTNVIATSIHVDDNLRIAATSTLQFMFNNDNEFPTAMIDRYLFSPNSKMIKNVNDWNTYINQRQLMKVPAAVTITNVVYNSTTRQMDATVSANFVGDVKGQYQLNLYIKENNVYGPISDSTDNGWNQYNGLYNIPSSQYYQYGNFDNASGEYIMSGASYKHKYVLNEMLDGWAGDPTTIPTNSTTIGQTYSRNYTYTLPVASSGEFRYNADNMYLVGVLSEYDPSYYNGLAILNSAETKLTTNAEVLVGVKEHEKSDIKLVLFPNPTSNECHLNYTLQHDEFVNINVYNTLGELVYMETKSVNAGNVDHVLNIKDLKSGNYSVQVSFKQNSITKKLTIIK